MHETLSIVQVTSFLLFHICCSNNQYFAHISFYQIEPFSTETTAMYRFYTDYSNENISIPFKDEHKIQMIPKVESVLKLLLSNVKRNDSID